MASMGFIDISTYRARISVTLYQHQGSQVPEISRSDVPGLDPSVWSPIPKLADFRGKFEDRNPLNIPGPFYGAETTKCWIGPNEAPNNVMLDWGGQEFVFRQPTTIGELQQVIKAAICDPFSGYGADGDDHWNVRLIREWWEGMENRLAQIGQLASMNDNTDQWASFSNSQAERYLRKYAFFVENQRLPKLADHLPDL